MMEIQKTITLLKTRKNLGRYYINSEEVEKYIDGFVLESSKEFILVREFVDFTLRSLVIIPINKITKIRQGKAEKSFTRIIKSEKLLDKGLVFEKIALNTYSDIFKIIKKRYKYVIIEDAFKGESNFTIGEIKRINKESVSLLYFDIRGKVDNFTTKVPFKGILNIEYESNYLNTFIKYLH